VTIAATTIADTADSAVAIVPVVSPEFLMIACWLFGVGAMLAIFALRQRGFVRSAGSLEPIAELGQGVFRAAPSHGPAVVGALRPMIVLPRDFGARFSTAEQALVLAHERQHLDRFDPMVNAATMGLRAVNWFNPLVHIAARALRIDQELACDAAVLARHAGMHRVYAEAMLKSHAAAFDIPVGCAWHTSAFHPLKERILMLTFTPSRLSRSLGLSFVTAAAVGVCGAVWLMRPVELQAAAKEPYATIEDEAAADATSAEEAMREALAAAKEAMAEARAEAKAAAHEAMREAHAAVREAMQEAKLEARAAVDEARDEARRDARAAAREAMDQARAVMAKHDVRAAAAVAAEAAAQAKLAMRDAEAAVAASMRAAEPAIAAAQREAELSVRRAMRDAGRAKALAAACRSAMAEWPDLDLSDEAKLRALEKLVCIPGASKRQAPPPQD
jgi:beta-lactamase regulating signal transducer with metallopeptidase domain